MGRKALAAALLTALIAACGGEGDGSPPAGEPPVPNPVSNEQALDLIEACRVTGVGGSHDGDMEISLKGGKTVAVEEPDGEALFAAAADAQERACDVEMYTE